MAYYRAGWNEKQLLRDTDFWRSINGNCIDIAVLEWCKLFADTRGAHYWKKIATDSADFELGLLAAVGPGMNSDGFNYFIQAVKKYRDKFVAHLDDELIAEIPSLNDCWLSVRHYHKYIFEKEAGEFPLAGLPRDLDAYYETKFQEAASEYRAITT